MRQEFESYRWARQGNFFELVPERRWRVSKEPDRTLADFVREGMLPAAKLLERIYVPYDIRDEEGIEEAWRWMLERMGNWEKFVEEVERYEGGMRLRLPQRDRGLPRWVEDHAVTVENMLFVIRELPDQAKAKEEIWCLPVAYSPSNRDFERDVRRVTWPAYKRVLAVGIDLRPEQYGRPHRVEPDVFSSSLIAERMNQLSMRAACDMRQASDITVGQWLFYYWIHLRARAKMAVRMGID